MTINIDAALLKRYWLSASATAALIWTSLNPTAQAQITHYISQHLHGHALLAGLVALILADLKQSPLISSPTPDPAPAVPPAPPANPVGH